MLGLLIETLGGSGYLGRTYQRSDDILEMLDTKRFGKDDTRANRRVGELAGLGDRWDDVRFTTLKL